MRANPAPIVTPPGNISAIEKDEERYATTLRRGHDELDFLRKEAEIVALRNQNAELKDQSTMRNCAAKLIAGWVAVWTLFVMVIIVLTGADVLKLNERVLMTLLTITTVEIIALAHYVAHFLFYRDKAPWNLRQTLGYGAQAENKKSD